LYEVSLDGEVLMTASSPTIEFTPEVAGKHLVEVTATNEVSQSYSSQYLNSFSLGNSLQCESTIEKGNEVTCVTAEFKAESFGIDESSTGKIRDERIESGKFYFTPVSGDSLTVYAVVPSGQGVETRVTWDIELTGEDIVPLWMYEVEGRWGIPVNQLEKTCAYRSGWVPNGFDAGGILCQYRDDELQISQSIMSFKEGDGKQYSITYFVSDETITNGVTMPTVIMQEDKWMGIDHRISGGQMTWVRCLNDGCSVKINAGTMLSFPAHNPLGLLGVPVQQEDQWNQYMTMDDLYSNKKITVIATATVGGVNAGFIAHDFADAIFFTDIYNTLRHVHGFAQTSNK